MNSRPNSFSRLATITLLCTFLLCGCSDSAQPWNRSDLVGYRYELKDRKRVQVFMFSADGSVMTTVGEKDGPLAGPVFQWHISTNGVLLIGDIDFITTNGVLMIRDREPIPRYKFMKIAVDEKTATVLASGKKQTWLKSKN
jgi:hypothetical protein